jgi:hypothetical protein
MSKTKLGILIVTVAAFAGTASAQMWSAEQQEVWKVEQQQWQMAKDKDLGWIDTMVHPNLTYWDSGQPGPQDKASLTRWSRYENASSTVLEQELFPMKVTITGNVAVAQYRYSSVRENYKKDREMVTGHYTDILIKEGGKWMFLAWDGGEDPKK